MYKKILLTGGAGFIGSNLCRYVIENNLAENVVVIDALKTGSSREWLNDFYDNENFTFLKCDLSDGATYNQLSMQGHDDIDCILHLAAESHVDRSINDAVPFAVSNLVGTTRLLEYARDLGGLRMFLNFCTDEVMGSRTELEGPFQPHHRKMPRNPYSASKSAQEDMGFAYSITHGLPVVTTRCTNIYGPRQYPEKFLPVIITKLIKGEKIPLYGEGLQEREWIHVNDVCSAVEKVLNYYNGEGAEERGFKTEDAFFHIHHIAGEKTYPNIDFLKLVIDKYQELSGDEVYDGWSYDDYFEYVEDRKGHDFRYDLDASSMKMLGWQVETSLEDGLHSTIQWYLDYYKA